MGKIIVVYWTQAGNTLTMAEAIGRGILAGGKEVEVVDVSSAGVLSGVPLITTFLENGKDESN